MDAYQIASAVAFVLALVVMNRDGLRFTFTAPVVRWMLAASGIARLSIRPDG
jgi:hypothetical protein